MRRAIRTAVEVLADVFPTRGPIVEIGSRYEASFERLANLRPVFAGVPAGRYIGCDIREGPGVDQIEDACALSFVDASVGLVVMLEVLEHLSDPCRAVQEAHRVLRADGLLVVSVPFTYRLHGFPTDYWRFTASGLYQLLAPFDVRLVFALGPRAKPAVVFGVAAKTRSVEFFQQGAIFQARLTEAYRRTLWRGWWSVVKERGRDFAGSLLGRADLSVRFFDAESPGGYRRLDASVGANPRPMASEPERPRDVEH